MHSLANAYSSGNTSMASAGLPSKPIWAVISHGQKWLAAHARAHMVAEPVVVRSAGSRSSSRRPPRLEEEAGQRGR